MIEEQRGIVTPEAVVLEFETAGVGSRAVAFAIDLVVMLVGFSILSSLFGVLVSTMAGAAGNTVTADALLVILTLVAIFLVVFGYPALMETFNRGRTVGKAICGLRVVTVEGGPVRFRHAALRAIFSVG